MKLTVEGQLRRAVWGAFAVGAALNCGVALAQDATQLQGVEVTGSRIRRVDTATSDTVTVLDRKQIQATGSATLGQLVQSIPAIGGTPYNSQVNNGGGNGEAYADLRGLGAKRTLILLDGQRLNNSDLNALPSNMIDRVEVLKEGAAAVYGTDAIGGVINFITRKNFTGLEAELSAGQTEHGDGQNGDAQLTWGSKAGGGNVVFGASFNRQDEIRASDRAVSREASALYYGAVTPNLGSSRAPGGSFNVGTNAFVDANGTRCSSVTLIKGRSGSSPADFRCFVNNLNVGYSDRYNYQTENLAVTPSKRFSLFGLSSIPVSDNIKWFGSGTFTNTRANNQIAAEPFDNTTISGIYPTAGAPTISANNVYNPFGRNITTFGKRSTDVGDRVDRNYTDSYQASTGLKGTLLDQFQWDTTANYGRYENSSAYYGFLDFSKVLQQIGPSFFDANGVARCGTAAAIIPNCTPINVFGTNGNTIGSLGVTSNSITTFDELDLSGNISGEIAKLPAGGLGLAIGGSYRTLHYANTPDALAQRFAQSEGNGLATAGGYNAREAYAESRVPLLAGLPGVKSLDLNLGVRFSNFSSFGSNTAGKYAFEYRPYSDLLLRGTYSDVYRAPTTTELFQGATQNSPAYQDPCAGKDAATLAAHASACQNVPVGYTAPNSQTNGNTIGNPSLQAEKGYSTDFGLVFNPTFYKPLTIEVDYWHYTLKSAIDTVGINSILSACYNDPNSAYCGNAPNGQPYFSRDAGGTVSNSYEPYVNANKYVTNGIDTAIKLNFPKVVVGAYDLGRFSIGVETSYLIKYDFKIFDPVSGNQTDEVSLAGQYDSGYTGNSFPRLRGLGYLFWSKGPFSASIQDRFVGDLSEDGVDLTDGDCATTYNAGKGSQHGDSYTTPGAAGPTICNRDIGAANYVDVAGTYTFKKINTDFTFGVNDLFSEDGQQQYSIASAGAANPLYDIRGRNYYGRIVVRFK